MTSYQLRAALKKLKLKQTELAALFGLAPRTVRHYVEDNKTVTNIPAAILVKLLVQKKITRNDIIQTGQSPHCWDEDDFYRRIANGPVATASSVRDRRAR